MKLSVVVATYNRCEVLRKTLACLANQTLPADQYEVIVVDDGSPDQTGTMVYDTIGKTPYGLRYFSHSNRGPGASENKGIRESRAPLVLLIADDIHPTPTMLASHVSFHQSNPDVHVAALGKVLQSAELPSTVFQDKWDPFKYYELDGLAELPYWKFWACNISLKREFLLTHGLFQELKGAAHEDVELGYRLSRKGLRIFYNSQALAYHYHVETLDSAVRRAYERGLNWRFIEENVPDPQIYVKYHILNWRTLPQHIATFKDLSHTVLPREDRNLPWLLFRQVIRWSVFNRLTIPLWLRLLAYTEDSPLIARLTHPYMYRGTVFYHFLKGAREQARKQTRPPLEKMSAAGS